jgi:hypothetical protein
MFEIEHIALKPAPAGYNMTPGRALADHHAFASIQFVPSSIGQER